MEISDIIKPENLTEEEIIKDDKFKAGCIYGKPRRGHPEGEVIYHIKEVLNNVDKYSDQSNRSDLRLTALIHDSFKYKVDQSKPRSGVNHHGFIARKFAEKFIQTSRVLETIELHDEAYNSWQIGEKRLDWKKAEKRAIILIDRIKNDLDFYLIFYRCDNETGDKNYDNYLWFRDLVEKQKLKTL